MSKPDIALRDHGSFGPMATFFKESMRRDTMIGIRISHALRDADQYQLVAPAPRRRGLHSWQDLDVRLNMHTR